MPTHYDIFEGKEEYIRTKTPFVGRLPFNMKDAYDWNQYIHMMDTHPEELHDQNTKKMRIGLNNFHSRPSAPEFARNIVEELKEVFTLHGDKNSITNIAFSGFGLESDSYPRHKDSMDVLLVQVISTMGIKVEGIQNEEEWDFEPGMFVYLPRGTYHQILPRISRLSFSFGIEGDPDPSTYF